MSGERRGTLDFLHWSKTQPDALALTWRGMGMSYAGLERRVNEEQKRLRRAGFGPRTRLALVPGIGFDDVAFLLAAIDLQIPLVLLHPALPERLREERARSAGARFLAEGGEPNETEQGTFAVLFTSGTTGEAKKVRISRNAVAAALDASASRLGWHPGDRWGLFLPPAHIGGLSVLLRCLRAGKTVVLASDARQIHTVCAMERVTLLSLVPTQLYRLLHSKHPLPSGLRCVLVGGARLAPSLRQEATRAGLRVYPTYGMTETCAQAATALPGEPGSGKLLDGLEGEVRDGILWVRGPSLFDGYEGQEGLDRSGFDEHGFFCTGDRASLDEEGHLDVQGRADDTIISGGENVDPAEVERALLETRAFDAVCVVGVPSEEWGQAVALVAVPKPNVQVPALLKGLSLPNYARPKLIRVVKALPLTPLAKVKRATCRRMVLEKSTPL